MGGSLLGDLDLSRVRSGPLTATDAVLDGLVAKENDVRRRVLIG